MITTGQTLRNRVTGETLVFRTTSADTNGERVVVETFVEPNGAVAAAHMHPAQEELFEVLGGELEFRVGTQTIVAKPGDRVLVPAGTAHRFRNIGDETAHFVCEVSPALGFEQLIETMFSLAADGKVNLFARIPHGTGQTYLREILLVADHGAYHVGQLVALRRALGAWNG